MNVGDKVHVHPVRQHPADLEGEIIGRQETPDGVQFLVQHRARDITGPYTRWYSPERLGAQGEEAQAPAEPEPWVPAVGGTVRVKGIEGPDLAVMKVTEEDSVAVVTWFDDSGEAYEGSYPLDMLEPKHEPRHLDLPDAPTEHALDGLAFSLGPMGLLN